MEQLSKSLAELDKAADELLKSQAAEKEKEEEVTADEIAANSGTPNTEDAEDNSDEDEKESKDKIEKSEDLDDDQKEEDSDEKIQKSDDSKDVAADEEEDSDEEDSEDDNDADEPEDFEKSMKQDFEDNLQKSIEGNEFFSAVVEVLSKALGDVQYDMLSNHKASQRADNILAKSLQATIASNQELKAENQRLTRRINKLEKSISIGFEQVMESLDEISTQPVGMRKSLASVSVHDRDFSSSINGRPAKTTFDNLSKSEVLNVLNNELYSGSNVVTASDIISYESGAPLRKDLQMLVENKCR